ncbi:UNVERIFIED_CONTAM: hypothetical protein Sradi_6999600 [Sesamum radiatum]|uniref:DUF4283 domain-containing protein n=1 Tax=Sesamum radiatum TaxID=300843 RepID=A0AAW2JDA4_SESRA
MLSSLTHTSHTNPTLSHTLVPDGGGSNGGESPVTPMRLISLPRIVSMEDRVRHEFNFHEFYTLATRVLDGDEDSLGKLLELKGRWERRFPEPRGVHSGNRLQLDEESTATLRGASDTGHESQEQEVSAAMVQEAALPVPEPEENSEIYSPFTAERGNYYSTYAGDGGPWFTSVAVDGGGYFLGRRPYFPQLEAFARSNWKGLVQVSATANGFFFFRFKTLAFMEEVIEEGPWLFQGQPVVLQPWEQGMTLRRQKHLQVPVWIRIRHLPMEYWTEDGLSAVASGIGTPLYTDKITKSCLRLDFARIKVDIEYEWLPLRCKQCCSLGHTANVCPESKQMKQRTPVAVYVQKPPVRKGEDSL